MAHWESVLVVPLTKTSTCVICARDTPATSVHSQLSYLTFSATKPSVAESQIRFEPGSHSYDAHAGLERPAVGLIRDEWVGRIMYERAVRTDPGPDGVWRTTLIQVDEVSGFLPVGDGEHAS